MDRKGNPVPHPVSNDEASRNVVNTNIFHRIESALNIKINLDIQISYYVRIVNSRLFDGNDTLELHGIDDQKNGLIEWTKRGIHCGRP